MLRGSEQVAVLKVHQVRGNYHDELVTFLRALIGDPLTFIAFLFLGLMVGAAILANYLVDLGVLRDPSAQDLMMRNVAPGWATNGSLLLLGADQLGRDELARIIFGARVSMAVGFATAIVSGAVGLVMGLLAGYYRGWLDDILMRLVDIQMGFPSLLLALAVLYAAGPGLVNLVLVLALTRWTITARVMRGLTMSLRESPFIESARAVGANDLRIMTKHILPNLLSMIVVIGTLEFARAMLAEAALSFLGLGIQPPDSSWGLMLSQGRPYIASAWWVVAFPGMAIFITTLSVNLVATWVRAISDPVQRWRWLQKGFQKPCDSETSPANAFAMTRDSEQALP